MSYSRWGQSAWYTYWKSTAVDRAEAETLVVAWSIGQEFELTLSEIESDLELALSHIQILTEATSEEIAELREYCRQFEIAARTDRGE